MCTLHPRKWVFKSCIVCWPQVSIWRLAFLCMVGHSKLSKPLLKSKSWARSYWQYPWQALQLQLTEISPQRSTRGLLSKYSISSRTRYNLPQEQWKTKNLTNWLILDMFITKRVSIIIPSPPQSFWALAKGRFSSLSLFKEFLDRTSWMTHDEPLFWRDLEVYNLTKQLSSSFGKLFFSPHLLILPSWWCTWVTHIVWITKKLSKKLACAKYLSCKGQNMV